MLHLLYKGWLLILLGAMLIGIGGVTTTLGWSILSTRSRMKSLLIGVYREIEINEALLKDPLFKSMDPNLLGSRRLYPRFKTSGVNALLTSGFFSASRESERNILRAIVNYESIVLDINSRLGVSDNLVVLRADSKTVEEHRNVVRESKAMSDFINQQQKLKELIQKKYRFAASECFLD
jgi:hypothetical protein